MPLHIFAKLFSSHITTDGKPTGLCPCETRLTACNGSNIPQFQALDIAIEWTPKGHQCSKHLQTRWYVADSPGPVILGPLSSSKLGIVQLNCTKLTSRCDPSSPSKKPTIEHAKENVTSLLHCNPAKISSRPILTSLKVLVNSLEHITSLSEMMPSLWYMHPESVQLLCNPWYMRNLTSSWTKVWLFQLKSLLIGSLHLPTHGKQMETMSLSQPKGSQCSCYT